MTNEATPRRTTTTYVADRATIRVTTPQGWARGVLAGIEGAFAGWALTTILTMVAYLTLRSNSWMRDTTPRDALGLGADLWVALLGGTSVVGDARYRAIPALACILLVMLVRLLLRHTAGFPRSAALFSVPGFLLTSWLLAAASGAHSQWWTSTIGATLIPLIASAWFIISRRSRDEGAPTMQHWISGGFKLGALCVAALAVACAVSTLAAVASSWEQIEAIHELLGASSSADTTFIVGVQILFAPSAMAWAAAWWSGAGFLTATDALHSLTSADSGPIPPIPLLGAVPHTAPGLVLLIVPIGLGVLLGAGVSRAFRRSHLLHQVAQGILASAVFATVTALWMWSATMSMGSSRLANMGPRVGWATLALVLEIVLPVVLVSLATHPTTRAIVGAGADRVRVESQSLRQRHLERRQREEAAASLTREEKTVPGEGPDEAWAQAARAEDVD